jgi:hypothetical protein
MKEEAKPSDSKLPQVPATVGAAKCAPDGHRWEFFDSFPGYEIFECRICRQKKFVNERTGQETYE